MAWTQTDLDNLEDAIAKGVKRVEYNDRTVEYRSLNEMLATRDLIRKKLGQVKKPNRLFAHVDKGTC